jgi:zinc protease
MRSVLSRVLRSAFVFTFAASGAFTGIVAEARTPAKAVAPAVTAAPVPWLYRGSDIPPDKAWIFGELPNGLRYAVRRNGVPPHQVSIRVAIDAGSLMEREGERGFAHFNEHLSFRGSRYVPDGEAKRLWQRLGATFGSDTNASTTPTQTIYKLDLPSATAEGLDESVKILSGMMAAPELTQAEVDAERRTVLAELREGSGPQQRVGDATRQLFFAGQRLGAGSPIGDISSLNAATVPALREFHDRWYRPEHTLVVIAGDADPAIFEALIKRYFSDWAPKPPTTVAPDFGKPDPNAPRTRVLVETGLPTVVNIAVLRPWAEKNDTIEYNRGKLIETVATRLINRRLETRARAGGSFLSASIDQQDISRSVDGTFIQIVPLGQDWQAAIRDVRGVIADALTHPSSQADIDREAAEFASALQQAVETSTNDGGGELSDNLVEAVNIHETVASPEVARDVFAIMHDRLTPAAILAATQHLMSGTPTRALLTLPAADPKADALLNAALVADVKAGPATAEGKPVSFDRLPALGKPGTVVKTSQIQSVGLQVLEFSNGLKLVLHPDPNEVGKVLVTARFGAGMKALPSNKPTVAWAAPIALVASGIGDLGQEELDRLTSARRINLAFDTDEDSFTLRAVTRAADLNDELKLMAGKLAHPGWDPAPVLRARAAMAAGYDTNDASPNSVINRDLQGLLHGGDPRWSTPTREQIAALTPASFRALWEPLLAQGPIELSIYGDFDATKAVAAVAATFGALAPRAPAVIASGSAGSPSVKPTRKPIMRTHRGPDDQAAAVMAWPTAGGIADVYESRKLDILAAIFNDRLFDQLREGEGASYSPNVSSQWPLGMASGGSFVVMSQVKPQGVDRFFALTSSIAAQMASQPVTADELARSVGPLRQLIARAASGNTFWLNQLGGITREPRKEQALITLSTDYARITPEELQATAKRWLVPGKEFRMTVLPGK